MKKLLLLPLLLAATLSNAQLSAPYWGPEYRKPGGIFANISMIGIDDQHYYILSNTRKKSSLMKFNMKHQLISDDELNTRSDNKGIMLNQVIHTKTQTFAYLSDRGNSQWILFASSFSNGKFSQPRKIHSHTFSTNVKVGLPFLWAPTIATETQNRLITSGDSTKVAYVNSVSFLEKTASQQRVALAVFDADLKPIWNKIQTLPGRDRDFSIYNSVVDNQGNIYLLAAITDKASKSKERGLPDYDYKIFKIGPKSIEEVRISMNGPYSPMRAAIFIPAASDEIVIAGMYTDSERKSGLQGIFFGKGTLNNLNLKRHPFEPDFLEGLTHDKNIEKSRGLSISYGIDEILLYNDGSFGFVAESYYVDRTFSYSADGSTSSTTYYVSNGIIIPQFSSDGELLHLGKIEKEFRSPLPQLSSYGSALVDGKLYLFYNTLKKGKEKKEISGSRKGLFADVSIVGTDGSIESQTFYISRRASANALTPYITNFHNGKFFVSRFIDNKRFSIGTINLPAK